MGINEKNFTTGELAPVGICSELTYSPPREARIPTETVPAPETTEATTPLRAGAEDGGAHVNIRPAGYEIHILTPATLLIGPWRISLDWFGPYLTFFLPKILAVFDGVRPAVSSSVRPSVRLSLRPSGRPSDGRSVSSMEGCFPVLIVTPVCPSSPPIDQTLVQSLP
jgi:hypothetical protein